MIARKAIERKTGARGLRSIMEGILLETMYDLPGLESRRAGGDRPGGRRRARRKPLYIHGDRADQSGERQCLTARPARCTNLARRGARA